ncbi:MAG: hypothetical protein IPP91_17315 [Betaproteobacteria bacterium]|nr:hypothetical protein [Betaproteobacteria bacterium]
MTAKTMKPRNKPAPKGREEDCSPIHAAPKQDSAREAWSHFADRLVHTLIALEEDEYLILSVKGTDRYVQFMDQGAYGMRMEAVSDYYLPEDEHLTEEDYATLMKLGWSAPTNLPDQFGRKADGSPNYFVDLARPIPYADVAVLAVFTLSNVHGATHPGQLEYDAKSTGGTSIRFPYLPIRRRSAEVAE